MMMTSYKTAVSTSLLLSALLSLADPSASDWSQWRGPSRDGQMTGAAPWPDRLDERHLRPLWRVEMASSYSGPLVVGDLVITTETIDKRSERVSAYSREDGSLRWRTEWEGAMKVPFFAAKNGSWIRSTPASDGQLLFVMGIKDVLVALNVSSGKEVWRYDFAASLESPLPAFGAVCSPLLDDDHVYVQAGSGFCKLTKADGRLVWRTAEDKGGMFGSAFSSPVRATLAGRDLLLVQAREALHGIDPDSGKAILTQPIKAFRGMNIQTPVVIGDRIFTSAYGGRSQMWRVKSTDEGLSLEEQWSAKHQGYMTSPVLVDGVIYNHLRNQRLVALDADTGADLWNVSNRFGQYLSLVVNGQQILALDQKGELFLFNASREGFRKVSSRKVGADTWAHVAVAGDLVVVRELDALVAYRWRSAEARASVDGIKP
jgi:outer membrane protein assembly factor BamB